MKRFVLAALILALAIPVFAQTALPEFRAASGSWAVSGGRVYQNDASAPLAKANILSGQDGAMVYEFNARYEDGAEDGHGGFGIHIFADAVHNGASWGCGNSYLLWLNYDEKPLSSAIPSGLSAQVYRSYTNSRMDLVESVDLNNYADLLTAENLSQPVPFRIWADGDTGEVRVYDPTIPELTDYYYFYINKKDTPLTGKWVAMRTNGIKMSFAPGL